MPVLKTTGWVFLSTSCLFPPALISMPFSLTVFIRRNKEFGNETTYFQGDSVYSVLSRSCPQYTHSFQFFILPYLRPNIRTWNLTCLAFKMEWNLVSDHQPHWYHHLGAHSHGIHIRDMSLLLPSGPGTPLLQCALWLWQCWNTWNTKSLIGLRQTT